MRTGNDADSLIAGVFGDVAKRLAATGLAGYEMRERLHLDPFTKDAFEQRTGTRPVSRTLRSADFPGLGPVDVLVDNPEALIELKWSYLVPDKIFEGVWNAIKLALLGPQHGYADLYVATGASQAAWDTSESADLFATGEIEPAEMWRRPLLPPRSPNRGKTVGEDLVIGARGNQPLRAPTRIAIRHVFGAHVSDHELRVVRVAAVGPLVEWPRTEINTPAAHPAVPTPGEDSAILLPPRVTQRWIETTAPRLTPDEVTPFLHALRTRGWNENELRERVLPYLPRN